VPTFLVTKPGEAGAALAAALRAAGATVLHLPAFEIEPPANAAAAHARLAKLDQCDLAIFVSPAAVRATRDLLSGAWPPATRIAAVGAGTAQVVHEALAPAPQTQVIAPAADGADEAPGSEALWPLLRALQPAPRRVLILRAEQGREWLGERLRDAGAEVSVLAVYRRSTRPWTAYATEAELAAALASAPTIVVTSSEAAHVVRQQIDAIAPAARATVRLVTMHPRIAAALTDAGFAQVRMLPALEAAALLQAGR
jgi:uroporphyrinogen III methyltransferase/synthase